MNINSDVNPDLVVYYNVRESVPRSTIDIIDSIANETSSATLYSDVELKNVIGQWCYIGTVFDITSPENIKNNKYPEQGIGLLYLPEGIIEYNSDNASFRLDPDFKKYIYPNDAQLILPIITSTGDFMNYPGYVVINVNNVTFTREINVYFNK
jgi:hypothetical protein